MQAFREQMLLYGLHPSYTKEEGEGGREREREGERDRERERRGGYDRYLLDRARERERVRGREGERARERREGLIAILR